MAAVKQEQKLQHVIDQKVAEGRIETAEAETVIAAAAKLERETAAAISLLNATIHKAAMERHEKQAVAEAGRKREEEVDKRDGQVAEVKHSDWLKKHSAVVAAAADVDENYEETMERIRERGKRREEERRREEEEERRAAAEEQARSACACCRINAVCLMCVMLFAGEVGGGACALQAVEGAE